MGLGHPRRGRRMRVAIALLTIGGAQAHAAAAADEGPGASPTLAISDARVAEGDNGLRLARFELRLSQPARRAATVGYRTRSLTAQAGRDYRFTAGSLAFRRGQTAASIAVPVIGDTAHEGDETFALDLLRPRGLVLERTAALGTILDDDAAPVVDVAATATPATVLAHPDETLTFELGAVNTGTATATDVVVDITMPGVAGLELPAECQVIGEVFRCLAGTLPVGQGRSFIFRGHYLTPLFTAVEVHAIAQDDGDPADDRVVVPVTIGTVLADVVPSATPALAAVHPGDNVDFRFSVLNAGPETATGVVLDVFSNGAVIMAAPEECDVIVDVFRCPVGTLAPGQAVSFAFTVKFLSEGRYSMELHAIADEDIGPGNDEAAVPVTVAAVLADLTPTSDPAFASGGIGESLAFTFGVVNNGPEAATNAVLDLRPGAGIVQAAPAECEVIVDVYRCPVGTLETGQAASFDFTLTFLGAGSFEMELHAIGEGDIAPENDRVEVPVVIQ